jgi:cytochrome c oxidase subunit I+III
LLFIGFSGYAAAGVLGRWIGGVNRESGQIALPMAILAGIYLLTIAVVVVAMSGMPDPTSHAHAATTFALLGYGVLHCGIGLVFLVNAAIKMGRGLIVPGAMLELRIGSLWHGYTAVTGIAGVGLVMAMPALIGMLEGVR